MPFDVQRDEASRGTAHHRPGTTTTARRSRCGVADVVQLEIRASARREGHLDSTRLAPGRCRAASNTCGPAIAVDREVVARLEVAERDAGLDAERRRRRCRRSTPGRRAPPGGPSTSGPLATRPAAAPWATYGGAPGPARAAAPPVRPLGVARSGETAAGVPGRRRSGPSSSRRGRRGRSRRRPSSSTLDVVLRQALAGERVRLAGADTTSASAPGASASKAQPSTWAS